MQANLEELCVIQLHWGKGVLYQNNRRCAFLNEESLCDLYKALGPDAAL